jgi:hypothetical protein
MKRLLVTCLLFSYCLANTQRYIWSPDSLVQQDPNYIMERYHDILRYHDPIMYLAVPVIKPIVERKVPLVDGEGKNGYWAEGNFAYRFIIYKGKYYSYPFFQRIRFTFDAGITPRLTSDNSSPLLPANNRFGLGLDFLLSDRQQLKKEKAHVIWTTMQLHHYSNGQADSFFVKSPIQRNNYRSGDFSTNYYKLMFNFGNSSQQKSIVTTAIGYQKDVDLKGALARSKQLNRYYGDSRLLFNFQWVQKPRLVAVNYLNRATAETDTILVERRKQFSFRTELEYILGDLSNFAGENKRRLTWHVYFTFMPSVTNEVGFIAHSFVGRDYLNIRFDDIVFIGMLGIYVKFNSK